MADPARDRRPSGVQERGSDGVVIDFAKVARDPSDLLAVVEHVVGTPQLDETDYLGWTTGDDLSTEQDAGGTARHLIAFGNRDPLRARRILEGHAYLLLGVEPGNLVGVPRWAAGDVRRWIAPFVNPELVYDVSYVSHEGADVLVLTVAPPKQGNPLFALQQTIGDGTTRYPRGTIYVRHGGRNEPSDPADIAMLTARARPASSDLAVTVDGQGPQLCLTIVNGTDADLEDVAVDISIPLPSQLVRPQAADIVEVVDERTTEVRFPPRHMEPQSEVTLRSVTLAIPKGSAGRELTIGWRATVRRPRDVVWGTTRTYMPATGG